MSDRDLIQALWGAVVETGSLLCLGCGYEHNCNIHGCAIIRAAAERLEQLTTPEDNPPLTEEDLRRMDGEPVFAGFDGTEGEWGLVRVSERDVSLVHKNGLYAPARFVFECGGQAYRCKPEEGTDA